MGELADYLIKNDANFRKARLPALYSDFRSQRTLNPDGYRANVSAWRQALSTLASRGLVSSRGSSSNVLVLNVDDSLLRALEIKQYGQPLALGSVIREAAAEHDLVPVQDFIKSPHSIYQSSWSSIPWSIVGWTLRQLGVIDPARGEDKLPKGEYVVVKNVEAAAKELNDVFVERRSRFERIFTKKQFEKAFSAALIEGQRMSDTDVNVLLKFLSRDKNVIEYDGQTIRIKESGEEAAITEEDSAIASLKELMESLKHQTDLLNNRIDELTHAAKEAVVRKNRVAALAALKSKKIAESSLATRYATLNQLEEVAAKLQQAADNVQLVSVMEASTGVLAGLNAEIGGPERVDSVMDHLREQMTAADEVGAILAESMGAPLDEAEIDDELEEMMIQEREKEEAEQREREEAREVEEVQKKLDALPKLPGEEEKEKVQTPTAETGIASLSVEDKPLRAT